MLLAAKPDDDDELPAARGHGPLGFNYMLGGARRLAFISYRRADSAGQTGRIHDHLKSRFGPGRGMVIDHSLSKRGLRRCRIGAEYVGASKVAALS